MIVSIRSWHYRIFTFFGLWKPEEPITACEYWSGVVAFPLRAILLAAAGVFISAIWVWEYIPDQFRFWRDWRRPHCPLGTVTFQDPEGR